MKDFFDLTTPAKRFRFIAWFEALTWLALLIAMGFKYLGGHDGAIRIPGMVHGVLGFCGFVIIALMTAVALSWNWKVTALALVSSVPPFGTLVFEWWAKRNGLLAELSTGPQSAPADGDDLSDRRATLDA